jgi:hypothetical protein
MASYYDIVRINTSTTGTGSPIALGSAVAMFRTPAQAGVADGANSPMALRIRPAMGGKSATALIRRAARR